MKKFLGLFLVAGAMASSASFANYECLSTTLNLRKEVNQGHTALFRDRSYYGHVGYGETWQEASNQAKRACESSHPLAQCTQPTDRDNCNWQ